MVVLSGHYELMFLLSVLRTLFKIFLEHKVSKWLLSLSGFCEWLRLVAVLVSLFTQLLEHQVCKWLF